MLYSCCWCTEAGKIRYKISTESRPVTVRGVGAYWPYPEGARSSRFSDKIDKTVHNIKTVHILRVTVLPFLNLCHQDYQVLAVVASLTRYTARGRGPRPVSNYATTGILVSTIVGSSSQRSATTNSSLPYVSLSIHRLVIRFATGHQ
jgi:hypothetical protein